MSWQRSGTCKHGSWCGLFFFKPVQNQLHSHILFTKYKKNCNNNINERVSAPCNEKTIGINQPPTHFKSSLPLLASGVCKFRRGDMKKLFKYFFFLLRHAARTLDVLLHWTCSDFWSVFRGVFISPLHHQLPLRKQTDMRGSPDGSQSQKKIMKKSYKSAHRRHTES